MGTVPRRWPSVAEPGAVRTLCWSPALGWCRGMPRSRPAGIPVFSLGFPPALSPVLEGPSVPSPCPAPRRLLGPITRSERNLVLLSEHADSLELSATLETHVPGLGQGRLGQCSPHLGHGGGGQAAEGALGAGTHGGWMAAPVSDGAVRGQRGCCPLGGVMGDPCWSPPTVGTPPPWARGARHPRVPHVLKPGAGGQGLYGWGGGIKSHGSG